MHNKKINERPYKKAIAYILIIIALLSISLVILEKLRVTDFIKDPFIKHTSRIPELTAEQKIQNNEAKKDFIENQKDVSQDTSQNDKNIEISVVQESDKVVVSTRLHGISNGICRLNIVSSGKQLSKEAQVLYQPQFSTCAGFTVPVSDIGKGVWEIEVVAEGVRNSTSKEIL